MIYEVKTHDELAEFLEQPDAVMVVGADWCSQCKPQLLLAEKVSTKPVYHADIDLVAGVWPHITSLPATIKCKSGNFDIRTGKLHRSELVKFLED